MTLEVHVGTTTAYKSTFPLCHAERGTPPEQGQATNIDFVIRPQRPIRWTGYRDPPGRTTANQALRVSLWEAGADPDAIVIGVSVMDRNRIYMNMIHTAIVGERRQSEIAEGVTITTYPARAKD